MKESIIVLCIVGILTLFFYAAYKQSVAWEN
jgi:Tfp pilus assembly protein PilE